MSSKRVATTRVYNLEDAARELSRRKTGQESSGCPVDILGIVTDGHFVAGSAKQCLRIVDQSCSAFVTVNCSPDGQSAQIGDIARFNRVGLRRHNRHFFAKASDLEGEGIPHFTTHQWDDPEAGQEWFCLGHVSIDGGSVVHDGSPSRDVVPTSMQTDEEQVERLVDWYLTSDAFRARTPLLSQIPHRPRTIEEMTSCVGVLGEIIALVEQVVESPILPVTHSLSRKRRRGMVPAPSSLGHVILSEVCNPSMPCLRRHFATLLDPEMRFLPKLRSARDSKLPVRICNVRSEQANQVVPSHLATHLNSKEAADDIVLVITKPSRVTILSSSHDLEVLQQQQQQQRREEGRREISSSSLAWRTEGNADGSPQMFALTATQGSSVVPLTEAVRGVNGHIVQIREDGNFNTLTRSCGPTFGIVEELERHSNGSSVVQRKPNSVPCYYIIVLGGTMVGHLQVKANRSVLRKLLGESRLAKQHCVTKGSSRRTGQAFLDALIQQETRLWWELRRRGNDWEVQSVSLHELR